MHNDKVVCMFDLESTLIKSWNYPSPLLSNIRFIKREIAIIKRGGVIPGGQSMDTFGIFSFAIDHENEKEQGVSCTPMELGPDIQINREFVICLDEMMDLCRIESIPKREAVSHLGKDIMFSTWANKYPYLNFVLFDDNLPNKTIKLIREFEHTMQTILMIRVD